jgi:hypothetical protein
LRRPCWEVTLLVIRLALQRRPAAWCGRVALFSRAGVLTIGVWALLLGGFGGTPASAAERLPASVAARSSAITVVTFAEVDPEPEVNELSHNPTVWRTAVLLPAVGFVLVVFVLGAVLLSIIRKR